MEGDHDQRRNWALGSDHGGRIDPDESTGYEGAGYGSDFDYAGAGGFDNRGGRVRHEGSRRLRGFRGVGPKGWSRSDETIRHDVCEALQDADVDVSGVSVDVTDGYVELTGTIDDRWAKRYVEDVAYAARGVRDVRNRIEVA